MLIFNAMASPAKLDIFLGALDRCVTSPRTHCAGWATLHGCPSTSCLGDTKRLGCTSQRASRTSTCSICGAHTAHHFAYLIKNPILHPSVREALTREAGCKSVESGKAYSCRRTARTTGTGYTWQRTWNSGRRR